MKRHTYKPGVMLRTALTATLLFTFFLLASGADISPMPQPEKAAFRVTNLFTVRAPKNCKIIRIWFAVPQEDAYSVVSNFKVTSDHPVRYDTDSWGNRVGYSEVSAPPNETITIQEDFDVTRSEIRNDIDPARTRPLTDQERSALARYLQPSTFVIVNDEIRKLASSIIDGETNPVLAARKLYDWSYKNINYWVKDPDHLKASSVGSTEYCLTTKTGNCTDFHSLFSSLAISSGIPLDGKQSTDWTRLLTYHELSQ
jgi:hypothetical protein